MGSSGLGLGELRAIKDKARDLALLWVAQQMDKELAQGWDCRRKRGGEGLVMAGPPRAKPASKQASEEDMAQGALGHSLPPFSDVG